MKTEKAFLSVAVIALVVLTFGLSRAHPAMSAAGQQDHKYEVKIDNFSFSSATLVVPVGATVTWTNHDDVPHTIVSSEGNTLKSPALDTDQSFSYTFTRAGTYPYYCGIHPKMTGKVVVQ